MVNVVDLYNVKNCFKLRCHRESVWSLSYNDEFLVTGSVDKTLRVLKWSQGVKLSNFIEFPNKFEGFDNSMR